MLASRPKALVVCAIVAVAAGSAGCGAGDGTETVVRTDTVVVTETAAETETTAAETSAPGTDTGGADALDQSCENPEAGFAARYPDGWHTNDGSVVAPCSLFHPEPFDVPEAADAVVAAISIAREPVAFDRVAGEDPATRVLAREETEVAGRPALRRETEATGQGLFPEGFKTSQYLVDLDGETLVMSAYELEGVDLDEASAVLDRMAAALELG